MWRIEKNGAKETEIKKIKYLLSRRFKFAYFMLIFCFFFFFWSFWQKLFFLFFYFLRFWRRSGVARRRLPPFANLHSDTNTKRFFFSSLSFRFRKSNLKKYCREKNGFWKWGGKFKNKKKKKLRSEDRRRAESFAKSSFVRHSFSSLSLSSSPHTLLSSRFVSLVFCTEERVLI